MSEDISRRKSNIELCDNYYYGYISINILMKLIRNNLETLTIFPGLLTKCNYRR